MWQRDQVDLSRGLDFVSTGPVFASFVHLQHAPFTYRITVRGLALKFLIPAQDIKNDFFFLG